MYEQCVAAVYRTFAQARDAVQALEQSDFPSEHISLVTHSVEEEVPRDEEEALQYGDSTERAAAKGAGAGGLIGLLAAAPLLTIPGIGPLIVAGPIAAGLTGAIVGGLVGAMSGWGVHPDRIKEYEDKLREGCLLVVAGGDPEQVAEAKRVLDETDAEMVHLHTKTGDDSPEIDDPSLLP